MKRHMARIFKRIEDGIFVKSDSEQMALEIKDLTAHIAVQAARIAGLDEQVAYYRGVCEEQALAIHIHEKGADEQAATERTLRRRVEELEAAILLHEQAAFDREGVLLRWQTRIEELEAL